MSVLPSQFPVDQPKKRGLFWFRHDLRLHHQPALALLSDAVDEATFVYILDEQTYQLSPFGFSRMGAHRNAFLLQTLDNLHTRLNALGHQLLVLKGDPVKCISSLLGHGEYTCLGVNIHGGFEEVKQLEAIRSQYPGLTFYEQYANTLFDLSDLPFAITDMPDTFSQFRKQVEREVTPSWEEHPITTLPPSFTPVIASLQQVQLKEELQRAKHSTSYYLKGGESVALQHLHNYLFEHQKAATYKLTRNKLDGWLDSTKFSPWLANGALSAREVMRQLQLFEQTVEKNESTYWIYFELLWREFFHWLQIKHNTKWFAYSGIQNHCPETSYDPKVFKSWCEGQTGYDIVDACMRQLKQTGYMSNRGRQLVASCLVHELRQDWRYGAAWFEHQLIDFDVGSNWGNWLYLAGVGSDPRGHRQFNLQKQTELYDPDGHFRKKWLADVLT